MVDFMSEKAIDEIIADIKAYKILHPGKRLWQHEFMTPERNPNDVKMAWLIMMAEGILPKDNRSLDPHAEMR